MTNYFKVYLTAKNGKTTKEIVRNQSEVMKILDQAKKEGYSNYTVIKRIKPNTDIPIGYGSFTKECKVSFMDNLETDWRVVGANVVNWDKYKKVKEDEER